MKTAPSILQSFLALDARADSSELSAFVDHVGSRRANNFAWSISKHFACLSNLELAHLVKVFTLLENVQELAFCVGSTSQVYRLLRALLDPDKMVANELTEWAFHTASNGYIPFGMLNVSRSSARSVDEYHRMESERFVGAQDNEAVRSAEARRWATARAEHHGLRENAHRASNVKRRAFLAELDSFSPVERLRRIARDDVHRIGSVPGGVADVTAVTGLSPAERHALLDRLLRAPRGPWARLRATLERLEDTTHSDGLPQP